ncbi:MAG TPA: DinB family protein [Candidatus Binatia bacterium]|nr:DinB family protein [Candidatus Binatia bacterium]
MKDNRKIFAAMAVAAWFAFSAARVGAQAPAAPVAAGLKPEVIRTIESAENHVMALAERFPADKYAWHPEGARSTGEVFMHIASGNYSYANAMGTPRPEGVTSDSLAKITEKAQIIEALKKSFAHLKAAVNNVSDPDKTTKMRGRDWTMREIMLTAAAHDHEHLGQLIAYARENGIVPPWSEEQARPAAPSKPGN